jgi:hypothetical protein
MAKDQKFCFISWDWQEQIDDEELTGWIAEGFVYFKYIDDGSDSYCLAGSNKVFTEEEALKALEEEYKQIEKEEADD